tara:strand:+ start:1759 stop:2220 length:462 start_codon:yes stop_codon:yes gene_type:complete
MSNCVQKKYKICTDGKAKTVTPVEDDALDASLETATSTDANSGDGDIAEKSEQDKCNEQEGKEWKDGACQDASVGGKRRRRRKRTRKSRKKRKSRKSKRRKSSKKKSVKVKASTMRKHSKNHTKRHMKYMKKMMKKGYSFKKAHRSAMRKVGK